MNYKIPFVIMLATLFTASSLFACPCQDARKHYDDSAENKKYDQDYQDQFDQINKNLSFYQDNQ